MIDDHGMGNGEREIEDLKSEIDRFKEEKDRVRAIVGRIGGVPNTHSRIINYMIVVLIVGCLVVSLWTEDDIIRLAMVELAIAILSLKLIYLIHNQIRVNHFQLWILSSLEWRMVEMLRAIQNQEEKTEAIEEQLSKSATADESGGDPDPAPAPPPTG